MKFSQLEAVIAIAETGSIKRAAENMGVTQPAVSKSIRLLELEVGANLLVRGARGVMFTSTGEVVLKRALAIRREMAKAREEIDWLQGAEGGKLSIGLTPIAASAEVATAIADIRHIHPALEVEISETRPQKIIHGLREGRYDLGLITLYGTSSVPGYESRLMGSFPARLICGRDVGKRPSLPKLFQYEWIDYDPREGLDSYIKALSASHDLQPPERITYCSSLMLAINLVAELGAVCAVAEKALPFLSSHMADRNLFLIEQEMKMPPMNVVMLFQDWETLSVGAKTFAKSFQAVRC